MQTILVSVLALVLAVVSTGIAVGTLVRDSSHTPYGALAVSHRGGITSGTLDTLPATAVLHEVAETTAREWTFPAFNTTFHGRSWFTRTGDVRYLQVVIDANGAGWPAPRFWLNFPGRLAGLTSRDIPPIFPFSMRQSCHITLNGRWFPGILRIHATGEIYIRSLRIDAANSAYAQWFVGELDTIPGSAIGVPSLFATWAVPPSA